MGYLENICLVFDSLNFKIKDRIQDLSALQCGQFYILEQLDQSKTKHYRVARLVDLNDSYAVFHENVLGSLVTREQNFAEKFNKTLNVYQAEIHI